MKQGRTLLSLKQEVRMRDALKCDFLMPANKTFIVNGNEFGIEGNYTNYEMTDLFHQQISESVGIPKKYYELLREQPTDSHMLDMNVNYFLGKSDKVHTIRTLEGKARAFLSDRYMRMDNWAVLQAILPILENISDLDIISCEITDCNMYLKAVCKGVKADIRVGDTVEAGIMVSNSEVGLGALTIAPLVYRLVCSNGMIVNSLRERKYHIHRRDPNQIDTFSSDLTNRLEDMAFISRMRDTVNNAISEAGFKNIVETLKEATHKNLNIENGETKIISDTAAKLAMSVYEREMFTREYFQGRDNTLYGLANAVTAMAQKVDSYQRSTELEYLGWSLIV